MTDYIQRMKVREILENCGDIDAEATSYLLHDIDQLPAVDLAERWPSSEDERDMIEVVIACCNGQMGRDAAVEVIFELELAGFKIVPASRSPAEKAVQGWKLVPIKPDQKMIEAGCENNPTQWRDETPDGFAADVANDVYVSMVRAAPECRSQPECAELQATYNDLLALQDQTDTVPLTKALDAVGLALEVIGGCKPQPDNKALLLTLAALRKWYEHRDSQENRAALYSACDDLFNVQLPTGISSEVAKIVSIWSDIAPGTRKAIQEEHFMLAECLDNLTKELGK